MKAIIIEEDRFVELVEQLQARKLTLSHERTNFLNKPEGISQQYWEGLIQDIHHDFYCTFVRWAQKEGVSYIR